MISMERTGRRPQCAVRGKNKPSSSNFEEASDSYSSPPSSKTERNPSIVTPTHYDLQRPRSPLRIASLESAEKSKNVQLQHQHAEQLLSMRRVMVDLHLTSEETIEVLQKRLEGLEMDNALLRAKQQVTQFEESTHLENNTAAYLFDCSEADGSAALATSEDREKTDQDIHSQEEAIRTAHATKLQLEEAQARLKDAQEQFASLKESSHLKQEQLERELKESNQKVSFLESALKQQNAHSSGPLSPQSTIDSQDLQSTIGKNLGPKTTHEEELLQQIEQLKLDNERKDQELNFKDEAIENAESIIAFLEESKEELQDKYHKLLLSQKAAFQPSKDDHDAKLNEIEKRYKSKVAELEAKLERQEKLLKQTKDQESQLRGERQELHQRVLDLETSQHINEYSSEYQNIAQIQSQKMHQSINKSGSSRSLFPRTSPPRPKPTTGTGNVPHLSTDDESIDSEAAGPSTVPFFNCGDSQEFNDSQRWMSNYFAHSANQVNPSKPK